MPIESSEKQPQSEKKPNFKKFSREAVFLAQNATEGDLKVLPSDNWGVHFANGLERRNEIISDLLKGRITPENAISDLKPDALLFDVRDLEEHGLTGVAARIRDVSAYLRNYNVERFAEFASSLAGSEATVETTQALYDGITFNRSRKIMMDAYGATGKEQIRKAIQNEAEIIRSSIGQFSRVQKVLETLKLQWATDEGIIDEGIVNSVLSQLSGDERNLFEKLQKNYTEYVSKGSEDAYDGIVDEIKENIPKIQQKEDASEPSESMQELEEDLKPFMDQISPPGMSGDPGIPPEDQDEYHTSPPSEGKEKGAPSVFFEITAKGSSKAPLIGFYAEGRKSYFDISRKVWSKQKQEELYDRSVQGSERFTITATVTSGVKAIPIPNGYALDTSSLNFSGVKPQIFRDQNGCFYIHTNGTTKFSVDFLKENPAFAGPPVSQDKDYLYKGQLSDKTEQFIKSLRGSPIEKAKKVQQYIRAHHFYPGGGDLQMAQALQYKLRQAPSDQYIQTLDESEYLECYSANTLFIAIMRKLGISTRLMIGHKVEKAVNGIAVIDSTTGHAESEVWDGTMWRRIDATPSAKPEDKKAKDENQEQNSSQTQQAEDNGIEDQQNQQSPSQNPPSQNQQTTPDGQNVGESNNEDLQNSEKELQNAGKTVEERQRKQQELSQKIGETESFEDLKKMQEEVEKADVFEDVKEDLESKISTKEEMMKEEIKEKMDEMVNEGFLDEERREQLEETLDKADLEALDKIKEQIRQENALYNQYEDIKEEIEPLVDEWFDYFVERLPKEQEVETDEDSLTRQGAFNRHSVMKPRNLLFGTVKNPRLIRPTANPKFLASIVVDVSGSMQGEKLNNARKLLIFYNELFTRINNEYGYIKYANYVFWDSFKVVKSYDQKYDSPTRYQYPDGDSSTVKARLMELMRVQGGTNMLDVLRKAAADLNEEVRKTPDYASSLYWIGDGEDTNGNSARVKEFLKTSDIEGGFGEHIVSAILLGDEGLRVQLAQIFGEENTTVASDFTSLIENAMNKFDDDISNYLRNKTV